MVFIPAYILYIFPVVVAVYLPFCAENMAMVSIMFGPKIDGSELVALKKCHGNDWKCDRSPQNIWVLWDIWKQMKVSIATQSWNLTIAAPILSCRFWPGIPASRHRDVRDGDPISTGSDQGTLWHCRPSRKWSTIRFRAPLVLWPWPHSSDAKIWSRGSNNIGSQTWWHPFKPMIIYPFSSFWVMGHNNNNNNTNNTNILIIKIIVITIITIAATIATMILIMILVLINTNNYSW